MTKDNKKTDQARGRTPTVTRRDNPTASAFYPARQTKFERRMMERVPRWDPQPLMLRLQLCRAMLAIHGYLGDAADKRIRDRIKRDAALQ